MTIFIAFKGTAFLREDKGKSDTFLENLTFVCFKTYF